MAEASWRIALVDSGLNAVPGICIVAARRFIDIDGRVSGANAVVDVTGHGTAIGELVATGGREIEWVVAQVLNSRGNSTAASVAAAIHWASVQKVALIHLSLGLPFDRQVLAEAIVEAVSSGIVVVASSPARGNVSYPAAYSGVIRATGDARCSRDEISTLGTRQADYGACPRYKNSSGDTFAGASIGAAHVSRFIVQNLSPALSCGDVRRALDPLAVHRGPERRLE
jgi:hypothetical protein